MEKFKLLYVLGICSVICSTTFADDGKQYEVQSNIPIMINVISGHSWKLDKSISANGQVKLIWVPIYYWNPDLKKTTEIPYYPEYNKKN